MGEECEVAYAEFEKRIKKFSGFMSTRSTSNFKDPNVVKHLPLLHDKYVIVSADKVPNNIVFVCESH
jgi:hypothetical protein